MNAPDPAQQRSRTRIRIATTLWFAIIIVGLLSTEAIARMDSRGISFVIISAATAMFTCMQVIVREMSPSSTVEVDSVRRFRQRAVSTLAARNLAVVSALYGAVWLTGALPF